MMSEVMNKGESQRAKCQTCFCGCTLYPIFAQISGALLSHPAVGGIPGLGFLIAARLTPGQEEIDVKKLWQRQRVAKNISS